MTQDASSSNENPPSGDVFQGLPYEQKVKTKKMMMYLIIFSVVMLFAGLTSAYLVSNAPNYWVHVNPPHLLWLSNIFIVLSSISIYMALKKLRAGQQSKAQLFIGLTFLIGLAFTLSQVAAWKELAAKGMGYTTSRAETGQKIFHWNFIGDIHADYGTDYVVYKDGQTLILENGAFYLPTDSKRENPVSDEVKGLSNSSSSYVWILIMLHILHLVLGMSYLAVLFFRSKTQKLSKDNWISLYTGGMYWHFLGILWIYLFVFLFYIH